MPRQPRYAKKYAPLAKEAILAGKSAHKSLALALGIPASVLQTWLDNNPEFATTVADARAELARIKAESTPAKAGRKSKYVSSMDNEARLHAASGKSDEDIAEELGISGTTLRNYRESHPSLHVAIQEGRDTWAVTKVEASMVKRAIGYEVEEVTEEEGGKHGKRTIKTKKHIPPDTKAGIFILTNRAPERYSNNQKIEHTGEVGLTMPETVREFFNSVMADAGGAE